MSARALAGLSAERPPPRSGPALLHDMSSRPRTPLRHDGVSTCLRVAIRVPNLKGLLQPARDSAGLLARTWCRALHLPAAGDSCSILRAALDRAVTEARLPEVVPVVTGDSAHRAPRMSVAAVHSAAQSPLLPPAVRVAVLPDPGGRPTPTLGLDVLLAIVAKSSRKVFLARKAPVLSKLLPGRELVLVLPDTWRLP